MAPVPPRLGTGDSAPTPLQRALLRACRADVEAFKPGNVAIGAPAHRMTADDFLRSAEVVLAPLADAGLALGARIEAAVAATIAAVGCNTNLGIVLLLAPMAEAAIRAAAARQPPLRWREHMSAVLAATTVADGAAVARAILLAHPAGLGGAPEADVSGAGSAGGGFSHTLYQAMALAAGRDQIARQYVSGFATVLAMADRLRDILRQGATREDAVTAVFVRQLAAEPDTHICRKHGADSAGEVRHRVAELADELPDPPRWSVAEVRRMASLHRELLAQQVNPGTTADLIVAAVFATELDAMQNF